MIAITGDYTNGSMAVREEATTSMVVRGSEAVRGSVADSTRRVKKKASGLVVCGLWNL